MNDQQRKFQTQLCKIYRKQDTIEPLIQGLESDDDKTASKKIQDCYIRLNTIASENGEKKQKTSEKISDKKQEVEIEKIFEKAPAEKGKKSIKVNKVLIVGPAGMGKSTMMKYFAYQWATRQLWKDKFDFVYRVPLKLLLDKDWKFGYKQKQLEKNPLKCLVHYYLRSLVGFGETGLDFSLEDMAWRSEENSNAKDKILLLLDGFDEVAGFKEIYQRHMAEASRFKNIILTSRPNALSQDQAKIFDRRIENSGLGNEGINQYFSRYFENDEEKGKRLQEFLSINPAIKEICNIPVNIAMLCFIWSQKSEDVDISNMSDLYGQVVHHLGVRLLDKRSKSANRINEIRQDVDIQMDELRVLQHVAYQSLIGAELENGNRVTQGQKIRGKPDKNNEEDVSIQGSIKSLREEDKLSNVKLTINDVNDYGLLKAEEQGLGTASSDLGSKSFTFLHASFQEYLTAQYLVEQLKSGKLEDQAKIANIANFIARHRNEPRFALTLKFMAGILRANMGKKENIIRAIKVFWDAILCNPNGALELGLDSKVNLLMNLLSQVFKENGMMDDRIPNQELAVKFIDCRVLENILWWVDELKKSDYISPNIKDGLLKILLDGDLSWSAVKSRELLDELSLKLQREAPVTGIEIFIQEQKEEAEELASPSEALVDAKLVQEAIDGAISSLIIKFSREEQERIIQKLLDDINSSNNNNNIVRRKMNTLIKIIQSIKISQENSQAFIQVLLEKIFDESLGPTAREGVVETLKSAEDPAPLKETVKVELRKTEIDQNANNLKGLIELAWAAGDSDLEFMKEIVEKITPLLSNNVNEVREKAEEILTELVEGCSPSINTKILSQILKLIFPMFENEKKKFRLAGANAIVRLINCNVAKEDEKLILKISNRIIPLLKESIDQKYYRNLQVIHALIPLLFSHKQEARVQEIAEILLSKLKNPAPQEIEEFGKTLELIAQTYGSSNPKLLQSMVKRLIPCLQSKRDNVKKWAIEYITTIAQASQDSLLCTEAIKILTPLLRNDATKTLTPMQQKEEAEAREKALESILELLQVSEGLDTTSFKKILNNLIKGFDTFNPSERSASSRAIKNLIERASNMDPKWLKKGIDAVILIVQKTSKVNKREIGLDTLLDLVVKDVGIIEGLITDFTFQMKKAGPELKARLGAMIVRLKELNEKRDIPMAQDSFDGLMKALKSSNDDIKLISAKNMINMYRFLAENNENLPGIIFKALYPLLKTKNPVFRATIIFYITEMFRINGDKDTQLMKDVIPKLVPYFQQQAVLSPDSQEVQRVALLGVARLFEMSKYTELIETSESFIQILINNQNSLLKDKEFESSVQKVIRAYKGAENLLKAINPMMVNFLKDDQVGKIVSEEMIGLIINPDDTDTINSLRLALDGHLESGNLNSKQTGRIFKVRLDLVEINLSRIENFIDALEKYLEKDNATSFENKQNAFAYLTEGLKISGYRGAKFEALRGKLLEILDSEICTLEGGTVELEPHVSNNIINLLEITGNQDKKRLKNVLLFFIAHPQKEEEQGEKESCGWVLKILKNENDKEFLNEVLETVIPKLGSGQHDSLVQKLSVFLLPHIDIVERYLNHPDDFLRTNFRLGLIYYLTNYLNRFEVLEQLLQENQANGLTLDEINTKLFDKVVENSFIKRTFGFSELQTKYTDMPALRLLLARELDRAETRQGIEVFQVAFIALAKVEISKDDDEAEKPLPELAWEVIDLLLKYFKKEKLAWISMNYDKLRSSGYNGAAVRAIFAKLYHKILEDKVIEDLEERLIALFIQQGLTTSITKKGEILFQGQKYDIEGQNIKFILEKIARIIIGMDQDLLAKQYKTNTPIFEKSYKDGGTKESAVDTRKISSIIDKKFVLRNDFWLLSILRQQKGGSSVDICLLEQRSAFGDRVIYKLDEEGQKFIEVPEIFDKEVIFGKYIPGLMFNSKSKILSSKTGQELLLLKESSEKFNFEDVPTNQEVKASSYYQQELLDLGNGDRLKDALDQRALKPSAALEQQLNNIYDLSESGRVALGQYFDGFISTFSSVYIVSTNVNSGIFQIQEIEAELSAPVELFTKMVSLIPYGIGARISTGIVDALTYVAKNKFKNNQRFIAELASDPVDLSSWITEIALKRLEQPGKRDQILNAQEEQVEVWNKKIQEIQNAIQGAITEQVNKLKNKFTQFTGEKNLFEKEMNKSLAQKLGESEANQMIEDWFEFCHSLSDEWSGMSRPGRRDLFIQRLQKSQEVVEEEINNQVNVSSAVKKKDVNRENNVTVEDQLPDAKRDGGSCNDCNIF